MVADAMSVYVIGLYGTYFVYFSFSPMFEMSQTCCYYL